MTTPHPRHVESTATTLIAVETALINAYTESRNAARGLEQKNGPGRPRRYSPEVAAARAKDRERRTNLAHQRAAAALKRLHRADFDVLLGIAKQDVAAEFGPLPGDPPLGGTEG